ncbi:MAG: hypothetical protein DCC55_23060 [Chloroflexi bacterium]|nr:MAG: hypothetical protein DCC55_23060 [Chloroflexota bacterium]
MYEHRQPLSDEEVAALFRKYLPVAEVPASIEKRLLNQVLAAVDELKAMQPTNIDRPDRFRNPRPRAATKKPYKGLSLMDPLVSAEQPREKFVQ